MSALPTQEAMTILGTEPTTLLANCRRLKHEKAVEFLIAHTTFPKGTPSQTVNEARTRETERAP